MIYCFPIQNSPAKKDYRDCGRAWAAFKDDQVVALRYLGDMRASSTVGLEAWEIALLDNRFKRNGVAKKAAIVAGHPGCTPRGGYIGEKRLIETALEKQQKIQSRLFTEYRAKCRQELARYGQVIGGMCSCWEFVVVRI